jgi:hypothetical protein
VIGVHPQPHLQIVELTQVSPIAAVHVFGLGDESDFGVGVNIRRYQDPLELGQRLAVGDQNLVFVQLDFLPA